MEQAKRLLKKKGTLDNFYKFRKNTSWLTAHIEQLREEHGGKYVAIRDEKIIYAHKELTKLLTHIHKKYKTSLDIHINYIENTKTDWLLVT